MREIKVGGRYDARPWKELLEGVQEKILRLKQMVYYIIPFSYLQESVQTDSDECHD